MISPRWSSPVLLLVLLPLAGCPMAETTLPDGNGTLFLDEASNDTFKTATAAAIVSGEPLVFRGKIDSADDVDVYTLGELGAGDEISIDLRTVSGDLDPIMALFDPDENLHALNDDRAADGSDLDPLLHLVVIGERGEYYLAVAPFSSTGTTGTYEVTIAITPDVGREAPEPLVVFFDWDGGSVNNPSLGRFTLGAFDATQVGLKSDDTAVLKDRVEQVVADRFAAYQFELSSSDDGAEPAAPHATIFFGGDSSFAFALSEHIDVLNADKQDVAVVFTKAYDGAFIRPLTRDEMGTAMGNTVAHEIGHLLGLVHTDACLSLMDSNCGNESLLLEQEFTRAQIDTGTFPIGWQDAAELIGWMLGYSS